MNLLDLKPTQISRNLDGNTFLIYGLPKAGKSTIASQFPRPIFLSTEKGLTALPGILSQAINSWAEFKQAVIELSKDEVRAAYDTIVVDTFTNLIDWLDIYIGAQLSDDKNTYKYASDVPYGKGATRVGKELNEQLQKLAKKGYLFVGIAHSEEKTNFQTKETMLTTSLDKKSTLVIDRFVDHILYLDNVELKNGDTERRLYFRGNNKFKAGCRYKHVPQFCTATFEELKKTLLAAIDKQEAETPGSISMLSKAELEQEVEVEPEYDFDKLRDEFKILTEKIVAENENHAVKIRDICEKELGTGKKVSSLTKAQAEILAVIVQTIKNEFKI